MTTLEIILIVILYIIGAVFTGVKDNKLNFSSAPICTAIFFPIVWFMIIAQAIFKTDWNDL